MDPLTIWLFCLATAWVIRAAAEDGVAQLRGQESPRTTRSRVRQEFVRQHIAMTGQLPIRHAVAGRVAQRIANPRREIGPARRYLAGLWEDSWDDAATRHEDRRRKREDRRREQAEREREQAERDAAGRPDPDNAARTRPCLGRCGVLVIEPQEWCTTCTSAPLDDQPEQPARCTRCNHPSDTFDDLGECPACQRVTREMRDNEDRIDDFDGDCDGDDDFPDTTATATETPEPDPAPDTTSPEETPMVNPKRPYSVLCEDTDGKHRRMHENIFARTQGEADAIAADLALLRGYVGVVEVVLDEPVPDLPVRIYPGPDDGPAPTPAPDTTRKDTPPVTTSETNGDVTSPLETLAFADSCLVLNEALHAEIDAMGNNLTGEGVGHECVQIVRDVQAAAEQFSVAAGGAREKFARHVDTQAEIASNPELRDTVRDTYLDTARA